MAGRNASGWQIDTSGCAASTQEHSTGQVCRRSDVQEVSSAEAVFAATACSRAARGRLDKEANYVRRGAADEHLERLINVFGYWTTALIISTNKAMDLDNDKLDKWLEDQK
ncbi:hypothetical protein Syun_011229 [Stephania yunnanensis]|uniref:Uncharacterized protein n=1 Tax=Stephania yunnanensis TaxID=152371 RepID=A0AAP0JXW0_9MAGN